jgi:hypothetical protein
MGRMTQEFRVKWGVNCFYSDLIVRNVKFSSVLNIYSG